VEYQKSKRKIITFQYLEYNKVHYCIKECILYERYIEVLYKFSTCGVSRYKVKDDHGDEDNTKRSFCKLLNDVKNLIYTKHETKCLGLLS